MIVLVPAVVLDLMPAVRLNESNERPTKFDGLLACISTPYFLDCHYSSFAFASSVRVFLSTFSMLVSGNSFMITMCSGAL